MKDSVTKFDFEAAFKALDEIEIPATGRVKANRVALTEIFSRKSKFDALMEEYEAELDKASTDTDSKLVENYTVKHGRADNDVKEFTDLNSALEYINSGIKKHDKNCYILYDENNKEMIWLDWYRDNVDQKHFSAFTVSRQDDKSIAFDTEAQILTALDTTEYDTSLPGIFVKTIGNELKELAIARKFADFKYVIETNNASYIDFDKNVVHYNKDEQLHDACRSLIKQYKDAQAIGTVKKECINKNTFKENISHESKTLSLKEEYYDISTDGLTDAKEDREAEIAQAKLARIEKIVDLDADSAEDLLTSYVGKYIMQCPQCMTLFYKDQADIEASEEDPDTVNVNEVCQHCGNESGYTLIGKVGEATQETAEETTEVEDTSEEELDLEIEEDEASTDDTAEEATDEARSELDDLADFDLELEGDEEEKKEEAFTAHTGEPLIEELEDDAELDAKLDAHNEYIEYLRDRIAEQEQFLEKATNEQIKAAIQRNIDAFKADLDAALPEAVKNDVTTAEEHPEEVAETTESGEAQEESFKYFTDGKALTEALTDLEVSADEFEQLINSPEFKKPISDKAVRTMLSTEDTASSKEDVNESLEEGIFDMLKSRTAKADFILKNAREDYTNVPVDKQGELVPDEKNQRFNAFIVVGFTNKYSNGKVITMAPSYNNKDLVVSEKMKRPEVRNNYKDADNLAKGWSQTIGNGPAFIYLAKSQDDTNAVFLCQYFKGDLVNDQVEKYYNIVKKDLKGAKLISKSGGISQEADNTPTSEQNESLENIFADLDELKESTLESMISSSLIEAYDNVAGFRLNSCAYSDEKFSIDGTIHFTSGNTRKTTYVFTEAYTSNDKIKLRGLNAKLGLDKKFTITGHTDTATRTFITESFKHAK